MKKILDDFIYESKPTGYDMKKLSSLNLIDNDNNLTEQYINITSTYKYLFELVLKQSLNLKSYDDALVNSNLEFTKVDDDKMDIYQYYSNMGLNYIYLRNNIYIENLTEEERKFILDKYNSNNLEVDNNVVQFINNTCIKAIRNPKSDIYIPTYEFYHITNNMNYSVLNTDIVLGVRYDEFYNDKLSDDEWDNMYMKREQFLSNLVNKMNNDLNNKNIRVLRYGEYSVLPRKKNDNTKVK